jgi:hypothetical protein
MSCMFDVAGDTPLGRAAAIGRQLQPVVDVNGLVAASLG